MKKMRKVAEFLKKAVVALRGKAGVLRARLLFLASLRRRTAVVGAISHHLRALMPSNRDNADGRGGGGGGQRAQQMALAGLRDDDVGLSELASLFQEVDDDADGRYPDWTHSLFDDDGDDGDEEDVEEVGEEEASVMEVIRRRREGEGEEFNMEEEIDHAADIFIRRVRNRMAANRRSF